MSSGFDPSPEHEALRVRVRAFAEREVEPQAAAADRGEQFNVPLFRRLAELGVLGVTVPPAYGGAGLDALAAVVVHEELAAVDPGFCLAYLAHAILFANNLSRNGSEAQRARWLPDACAGRTIAGMALSEPSGGTDVLSMQTRAVADGDVWVLNGRKMWVTNGVVGDAPGDVFLVYARTGAAARGGLSLFIVEREMPGFRLGQRLRDKLGMRASATAELVFEDCRLSRDHLVGRDGQAVLHMMRNLEIERLTLAAMGVGIARRCLEAMAAHAREQQTTKHGSAEDGQLQRHLAEAYASFMAGRCYLYHVAARLDLARARSALDADGVKLFCATMAKDVADSAIQTLGDHGGGQSCVGRLWRDARLLGIGGGTLEAHQANIARELRRTRRIE